MLRDESFNARCCLSRSIWCVTGSYSAKVPKSFFALVHMEFVRRIVENKFDDQEERKVDKRDDGEQREENGRVEESHNKHMTTWRWFVTHDVRTTNTRLEPRMTLCIRE